MYQWRRLSSVDRFELLQSRRRRQFPWHTPPRWQGSDGGWFHVTAACYEHAPFIGQTLLRMSEFSDQLVATCAGFSASGGAWCVLPNHYHVLVRTSDVSNLARELGRLHGRCSRRWNADEEAAGRKVFHGVADRLIRSEGHFWAALNYVHHNPVRYGYVTQWQGWPWSSALAYLQEVGRDEARRIWQHYPILEFGAGWHGPTV
jgi:putative transposase